MKLHNQPILLVEDSEDDVFFMKRALKEAQISNPLNVAVHGQEAIDYLSGTGRFTDRIEHPIPSLFFWFKLPFKHGFRSPGVDQATKTFGERPSNRSYLVF